MENVSAQTAPYAERSYGDIPIAGLLGYDFIAGAVIHVDYYHGTVEAIAPAAFTPPAGAKRDAAAFEGDDYDGLIGQDVLRNFDVYFDYAQTTIYLVPNQRYMQRWGS